MGKLAIIMQIGEGVSTHSKMGSILNEQAAKKTEEYCQGKDLLKEIEQTSLTT